MDKAELLIGELAELTGVDVSLDASGFCELEVDGNLIVLRHRPSSEDWLCFGVVRDGGEEGLPREVLAKALELGLFGTETGGCHLGLYGNALVLSDTMPLAGLVASAFAERILDLSRRITHLSGKLEELVSPMAGLDGENILSGLGDRFIQV